MIDVSHLSKRYGNHLAVDDVSFHVDAGEILGFLGPNGAGKSTTMNILTGYLSASSGRVKINGFDVLEQPTAAKANIGYLPEQPPLYPDMTVREYLDFLYELKKCTLPRQKHIAEICRILKIQEAYPRLIKNLSKGYRQRVGMAGALMGNPPVLVLDEPTVGLDPNQIIEMRALIRSLGRHHTVILSSHILPEIEAVCDRIVVINEGRIVADDTAANLSAKYSDDHRLFLKVKGPAGEVLPLLSTVKGVRQAQDLGPREPGVNQFCLEPEGDTDPREEIFRRLADRSWPLLEMKTMELSLEQIFIELTRSAPLPAGGQKRSVKKRAKKAGSGESLVDAPAAEDGAKKEGVK